MSDTADSIALSLKSSSDGRGGIDSDDIKRLTKQKIFIPTTINDLEHHLNHAIHILALVLYKEAFVVNQLTTYLLHIKAYCDLQRNDQLFAARLLYVIDVRMQNLFSRSTAGGVRSRPVRLHEDF